MNAPKMTVAMARQLEIVRTAGMVRDDGKKLSVKGLTTPTLRRLAGMGLLAEAYEIVPTGKMRVHARLWIPVP